MQSPMPSTSLGVGLFQRKQVPAVLLEEIFKRWIPSKIAGISSCFIGDVDQHGMDVEPNVCQEFDLYCGLGTQKVQLIPAFLNKIRAKEPILLT